MLLVAASAALVVFVLLLARSSGLPLTGCVWKCATGIPCAGCGGTRALAALANGSLLDALAWNPGAVIALFAAAVAVLYAACVLVFRREPWRPKLPAGAWWTAAAVFLIAANWAYLLLFARH